MSATLPTVEELIGKDFVKQGNWTEDRKEALKHLTGAEIDAAVMRSQAERPEGLFTAEELRAMAVQLQRAQPAGRCAGMAGV